MLGSLRTLVSDISASKHVLLRGSGVTGLQCDIHLTTDSHKKMAAMTPVQLAADVLVRTLTPVNSAIMVVRLSAT